MYRVEMDHVIIMDAGVGGDWVGGALHCMLPSSLACTGLLTYHCVEKLSQCATVHHIASFPGCDTSLAVLITASLLQ